MGSRLPSSRMRPGPTARMLPSWGFSLAVSGRTMPLFVISSRAVGLATTRSPSGLSLVEAVALANVLPSCDGDGPSGPGLGRPDAWRAARSRPTDADLSGADRRAVIPALPPVLGAPVGPGVPRRLALSG